MRNQTFKYCSGYKSAKMLIYSLVCLTKINYAIFEQYYKSNIIKVYTSSSGHQEINGSRKLTFPDYVIDSFDKKYDWCSNCGKNDNDLQWISFYVKNQKFKFNKYFIKTGCNPSGCCCEDYGYCVKNCIYSWSLQISNDNQTWIDIHRVSRDDNMDPCISKEYDLQTEYSASFVRIFQNEKCQGSPPCLSINKFELFGDILKSDDVTPDDFHHDEDISIIGFRNEDNPLVYAVDYASSIELY